jgi:ribosomal protein S18 acetylase RimI-like enzyme
MQQIQVRPAVAADADRLRDLVTGLSPRSAFLRFCAGIGTPSARMLAALLRQDATHGAWLVTVDGTAVGHLSWAVVDDGVVEIGVMVADQWQRRGLGRALVDQGLGEAAARGASQVRLVVHLENSTLLRRLSAGAASVRREDYDVVIDRPLTDLLTPRRDLVLVA